MEILPRSTYMITENLIDLIELIVRVAEAIIWGAKLKWIVIAILVVFVLSVILVLMQGWFNGG